jgi:hypothetical protein
VVLAHHEPGDQNSSQAPKLKAITQSGARCVPHYHFKEAGRVGMGCARPTSVDDVHFFKDGLALIPHARVVPGSEISVPAFHFTSLLLSTPKLMVNVEVDDYGVIETRSCGCPLEEVGYTEHLREIRSFRKLTGEGVTLVGSEMIRILEEVLPTRFGGSSLDYQMVEEEDGQGLTRLTLLISPKLEIADDAAVIDVVLDALGRNNLAGQLTRGIWTQARTLRVKRQDPIWTSRGKLMPLHLVRHIPGSTGESRL